MPAALNINADTLRNLRGWFSGIEIEDPQPWHWDTFLTYVSIMPTISCRDDYCVFLGQAFDAETRAIQAGCDQANIWFHCLLFLLMQYELEEEIGDAGPMCFIYGDKFAHFPVGAEFRQSFLDQHSSNPSDQDE